MTLSVRLPMGIMLSLLMFSLLGCGEKTVVGQNVTKSEQAQACLGCHETSTSPGTGKVIITEWKASVHNTKEGASCLDCHEPQDHPNNYCGKCHNGSQLVGADEIQRNPDRTGKCLKCHNSTFGYHGSTINGVTSNLSTYAGLSMNTQVAHFNNITGSKYPGSFVSSKYLYRQGIAEGACRKCHNPHDPSTDIKFNRDWSRSAHGTTPGLINAHPSRLNARAGYDFKTAGTSKPASLTVIDTGGGNYEICIRCHTTTGYINYVTSGFSSLTPFAGPGYPVKTMSAEAALNPALDRSRVSPDKSKELTNCNVCHDDGNGVSYSFKLRKVPQVSTFYNFTSASGVSMSGGKIVNFSLTYPDVSASNMCVACHSGRLTGLNIKMADVRNMDLAKSIKIASHFRTAAEMLFRPTDKNGNVVGAGFEFYSSGSNKLQGYDNVNFTHNIIGTTRINPNRSPQGTKGLEADSRGYGPCIGCHLNLKDSLKSSQTSHTFLPVNREASDTYRKGANPADPITGTVSKACAACHALATGEVFWDVSGVDPASGITANQLELKKIQFKSSGKAFARLLAFAIDSRLPSAADIANPLNPTNINASFRVWVDGTGLPAPATTSNWYGSNTTGVKVQPWLRTATTFGGAIPAGGLDYYVLGATFIDPLTGAASPIRNAAYTMGAVYNYFLIYYDPGAFTHNSRYVKRLTFDSMDWLDDGKLNKSVCDPTVKYTMATDATKQYPSLNTFNGGLVGATDTFRYSDYLTADELKQASLYICGNLGSDHRPAP